MISNFLITWLLRLKKNVSCFLFSCGKVQIWNNFFHKWLGLEYPGLVSLLKTLTSLVPYFPPTVVIGSIEYSIHLYSAPCPRDPNCGSKISGRSRFSLDDRTWETFRKNQTLIIIWWLSCTFYFGCLPRLSDVENFVWTHLVSSNKYVLNFLEKITKFMKFI